MVASAIITDPARGADGPLPPAQSLTCRLVGGTDAFALEHRISNGVLVVGAVISLAGTAMNGALGLPAAVVLLPETPLEGAVTAAERIRQTVASHRFPGGVAVTLSLGVSTVRADDTEESFIGRADAAAYDAKRQGRNRVLAR